jgi:flagellar hook-associated protein 2
VAGIAAVSSLSVGSSGGSSPLSVTGLASGLDTSAIIKALLSAEREPIARLTAQQEKLQAQQGIMQGIQTSLQQLEFAVSEFTLPGLFETSQTVTSSEPLRVSATTSTGAGVGGYEVEVKQLANSAQRSYTFTSPAAEETVTIDGNEYTLKAGATAKELAAKVNSDSKATVYAAIIGTEGLVLSNRATGATEGKFITVSSGGVLTEKEGTAKEGKNAEFTVDGVAGTSTSNVVTTAIAGVTLTLAGLTTTGPVTIDVQAPGVTPSAIESKIQSFVTLYNSTVESIEKQLTTKPSTSGASSSATGSLFGDPELSSLLSRMRQTMYEPVAGLTAEMSSPYDIGLGTGAATGGTTSQSALEGQLKLEPSKLLSALQSDPEGAKLMLQKWSQSLQGVVRAAAEPGGSIEARSTGEGSEISELKIRINTMNEMLAVRQKALEQTYAALEGVISKNTAQNNWLVGQAEQLNKSGL